MKHRDCQSRSRTGRGRLLVLMPLVAMLAAAPTCPASQLRRSAFVQAVARAKAAVVNIHGNKIVPAEGGEYPGGGEARKVNGMGTGVIIDPRGFIVTNYHVVEGVTRIQVGLADGTTVVASMVAHDPQADLAVIKIPAPKPLPVIPIGTSSDLMHGEDVIAIGNAYGYGHSVSRGVISALHRSVKVNDVQYYDDLIQTDASINPGNSGGPLLNIDGQMIGLNAAVRMEAQGIGFAIPVDQVVETAARMINPERLHGITHGLILEGASGDGVLARGVRPASPAAQAGIQPGDRIQMVDGVPVERSLDVQRALLDKTPGDTVLVQLERDHETKEVILQLGQAPPQELPPAERAWQTLGVQLEPIPAATFARYRPAPSPGRHRFEGGLRVTAVRPGSPAAEQQIRPGDILVGLYQWETVTLDHVDYILTQAQQERAEPLVFYVVRDGKVLYGYLQVGWGRNPQGLRR